jgi:phage baseplate assembly protein W
MSEDLDRALLRRRALGWSLACIEVAPGIDLGRDLQLTSGPSGTDLARVEGIDALNQALAIGLTTGRGTDVFNTDFGFDGLNALADETEPVLVRERVRVSIITLLQREPRVRRIVDVKFADDRLEAPVPGSRELDVRVAFEAISGDTATASLGQVVLSG